MIHSFFCDLDTMILCHLSLLFIMLILVKYRLDAIQKDQLVPFNAATSLTPGIVAS